MFGLISKKRVINVLAQDLAYKQKKADKFFYVDNNREMSSFMLDGVWHMRDLYKKLGISSKAVYDKAYTIYDFKNSGKKDFVPDTEDLKKTY